MNKTERCLRNEERNQLKRYKDECVDFPTRQMSDEEFDRHWGKHECMKQYKKCLDAVREKKNKLKKLIETSKLLMNQEIENINKSLGI